MPRSLNAKNISNYHYKLSIYKDDHKKKLLKEEYFHTQEQLKNKYNMNHAAAYYLMNPDKNKNMKYKNKKFKKFTLEKIKEKKYELRYVLVK